MPSSPLNNIRVTTDQKGATTTRIIEIYISTIKVLRVLDPSDAVLDVVATYVTSRSLWSLLEDCEYVDLT